MTTVDPSVSSVFRERPRGEQRPMRVVTDEEGHIWRVREVRFADATPSLIFESELGFRRVRVYPQQWLTLSEDELLAVSWQT